MRVHRFRLVHCQLDELEQCGTAADVNDALQDLPTTLVEMYRHILVRIKGERRSTLVRRALQWLVAFGMLPLEAICEAVTVERDKPFLNKEYKVERHEHILELCSSLVKYDATMTRVTLSHATVLV